MNRYSKVFAMGCSFVQGSELGPNRTPLPQSPVKHVQGRFSQILAEHFDAEEVNLAQGGAGQDRIFRSTFDWVNSPNFNSDERILFVLGLSSPLRSEMWNNTKNRYVKFNLYNTDNFADLLGKDIISSEAISEDSYQQARRLYYEFCINEEQMIIDQYRLLTSLKHFIKHKSPNSDIFIFNSLGEFPEWFRDGLGMDSKYFPSWDTWINRNGYLDRNISHPNEKAHQELAEYIKISQ